jgi:hypothetical protein
VYRSLNNFIGFEFQRSPETGYRKVRYARIEIIQTAHSLLYEIAMSKLDSIIKSIVKTSDKLSAKAFRRYSDRYHLKAINNIPVLHSKNIDEINEVLKCCRDEIQNSEDSGIMPAPKCFEQAADLSRAEKQYENEIAICEMYIGLVNQYAAREKLTEAEISTNLLPNCAPFVKRIHFAKIIQRSNST